MKEFADDNFRFDENDREFSKRVENPVGKGIVLQTRINTGLFGKGLRKETKKWDQPIETEDDGK